MKKWPFILVGAILIILLAIGLLFFYFSMQAPSEPKKILANPVEGLTSQQAVLQFNEKYIDYMIFAIGGWKLHETPFSDDTPKIKIVLENNEIYFSEIIDTEIKTEKRDIDEEDIVILTTRQEIVDALLSLDMKEYMQDSFQEGRSSLELKAGKTTLLGKGYLSLYEEMTGETITGSIIRIFS